MANIAFNPSLTTNAYGLFTQNTNGFVQGDAQDDPAVKFWLAGGVVGTAQTAPMWGGLPVEESIPSASTQPGTDSLGGTIITATSNATITGFSVFNQSFNGIITAQSEVPLYTTGMSINFYRLGSGARIPLPIDPTLVSLDGTIITSQVSWDFVNNKIIAYNSGVGALPVRILKISTANNKGVSYSSVTGFANWDTTATLALCLI